MDNDMSLGVLTTVSLMVVSIIAGFMMVFAMMGQNFSRQGIDSFAEMNTATYSQELRETAGYGAIPAASVYMMLLRSEDAIQSISGDAYGEVIASVADLQQIFHEEIIIEVSEDDVGGYHVIVKEAGP